MATPSSHDCNVVVLAGGVGGSKLVRGLAAVLAPDRLTAIVNTADDFVHMGLHVSPDLDTVVHRLAGVHDTEQGWGRADETWTVMDHVTALEGPDWFSLGDRDLATHLVRTHMLSTGASLADVTAHLCSQWDVQHPVLPMTNDRVATRVHTAEGELSFQDWFVRRRHQPRVEHLDFAGAEQATPSPGVVAAISRADLVVLAPSNPFVSIDPILAVPAIGAALRRRVAHDPVVAVSPIVGGRALRGPAARLLADHDLEVSATGVARHIARRLALPHDLPGDGLTGFVGDVDDPPVDVAGVTSLSAPIVMDDAAAEQRLARQVVADGLELARNHHHDVVTVVPVGAATEAKSRLDGVLDTAGRDRLARDLATATVRTAATLGPVVAVVDDDAMAIVAGTAGATVLHQDQPGLNAAVSQGIAWATRRSDTVMVIPSDLPAVTPDALHGVLDVAGDLDQGLVVVPDQRDDGTNALVLRSMPTLKPQYGPGSAAAHVDAARAVGVEVVVHHEPALADLDTREDLHDLGHHLADDPRD